MATLAVEPQRTRTGPSEALQIARNLWTRCGPRYALFWFLQGTLCRLLKLRVVHIIVHDRPAAWHPSQELPPGYELRMATAEELSRGVPGDPSFPDWATLRQYLAAGDLMIAAFFDGQIVSYGWCSSAPAAIGGGMTIQFNPQYLYGHRAYTTRRHRGHGLHAAIIAFSRRVAAERGQSMVAYIDANNYRSLVSESRVGVLRAGLVVISQRPGKLRYWASRLSRKTGFTLQRASSEH